MTWASVNADRPGGYVRILQVAVSALGEFCAHAYVEGWLIAPDLAALPAEELIAEAF